MSYTLYRIEGGPRLVNMRNAVRAVVRCPSVCLPDSLPHSSRVFQRLNIYQTFSRPVSPVIFSEPTRCLILQVSAISSYILETAQYGPAP